LSVGPTTPLGVDMKVELSDKDRVLIGQLIVAVSDLTKAITQAGDRDSLLNEKALEKIRGIVPPDSLETSQHQGDSEQ